MPSGSVGVPTYRLREAVAAEVDRTSIRKAAADVGISPMGLHRLLNGSEPQTRTRRKLEAWYVRRVAARSDELSIETASAALGVLMQDLAPADREDAFTRAVRFWEELYDSTRTPHPHWLDGLLRAAGQTRRNNP